VIEDSVCYDFLFKTNESMKIIKVIVEGSGGNQCVYNSHPMPYSHNYNYSLDINGYEKAYCPYCGRVVKAY